MKRAVICIGVNRAGTMPVLRAAVQGAVDFAAWAKAKEQGCETKLLTDAPDKKVTVDDVFDAVSEIVNAGTYDVLTVYFSGHGILIAPGAEFWLLSKAPQNPNQAVNLLRSVEDARNSGIPHVIFISDACRSAAKGLPLTGVTGSVIFPNQAVVNLRSEVDVYYATRPGDPAYEVPAPEAAAGHKGIFTARLLKAVKQPKPHWIESTPAGNDQLHGITSRKLKPYLEEVVPQDAAAVDIRLRQTPEVRVETAFPKFFALANRPPLFFRGPAASVPRSQTTASFDEDIQTLASRRFAPTAEAHLAFETFGVESTGLTQEVASLLKARGRASFETRTGFSVFGARPVSAFSGAWHADVPFSENGGSAPWHIRLIPKAGSGEGLSSTVLIEFDCESGTALAVLPGFIGTVVVDQGRVTSVSYVPSAQSERYADHNEHQEQLETMRACAAVAARHGQFLVIREKPEQLANFIRQGKGIDPALGLFAAYAYCQVGKWGNVRSVCKYMSDDEMPIPFDVVLLANFRQPHPNLYSTKRAPFCPMLSQGWAFLTEEGSLFRPIHQRIRQHLIPSLWTTFTKDGIELARAALAAEEEQ